jgi:outer membrane protein OmpA-like peptidoglycan-associated protein
MTDTLNGFETIRGRTLAEVRKHDWLKSLVLLGLLANALFFCGRGEKVDTAPAAIVAASSVPPLPVVPAAVAPMPTPAATSQVAVAPPAAKLYFDTAKFDLQPDAEQALKPVIEYAKANPSVKLTVSGFHDKRGNPEANAELAKNRAKVVAAKLNEMGIIESRVFLEKPQEVVGGTDDKEARRVEVGVVGQAR